MYSTLYIEQYFYGSLLSSLIIDTFWHFHNHPVKCFGHTHLNKEDKFRPEAHHAHVHTWQPRRDSSVRPKARSNISNSSSVASSSIFAKSS